MVNIFSRSGVANSDLFQSQRVDDALCGRKIRSLAVPNATRWLGLHKQAVRNRELRPNICVALCGNAVGLDEEGEMIDNRTSADSLASSEAELSSERSDDESEGEDAADEGGSATPRGNGQYPNRHRLLTNYDFDMNSQWESCLATPADVSAILQTHDKVRLDCAYLLMHTLLAQLEAPRLQVVQGRASFESWEEFPVSRLHNMFKEFRKVMVQELVDRFKLRGTPNEHVLLCFKLNPFLETGRTGTLYSSPATQTLMETTYKEKLRLALEHK